MQNDLQNLIKLLGKLPGLGPRSGRRATLHLLKNRDAVMVPLLNAMEKVAATIRCCEQCGNYDTVQPCHLCSNPGRDRHIFCIVEDVADLWALERAASFHGQYHVLNGMLSALSAIGPEELRIPQLIERIQNYRAQEVIIALNATLEGQTTAYYLLERLEPLGIKVSALAHGVPVGGELDYLDDGTLNMALTARRPM